MCGGLLAGAHHLPGGLAARGGGGGGGALLGGGGGNGRPQFSLRGAQDAHQVGGRLGHAVDQCLALVDGEVITDVGGALARFDHAVDGRFDERQDGRGAGHPTALVGVGGDFLVGGERLAALEPGGQQLGEREVPVGELPDAQADGLLDAVIRQSDGGRLERRGRFDDDESGLDLEGVEACLVSGRAAVEVGEDDALALDGEGPAVGPEVLGEVVLHGDDCGGRLAQLPEVGDDGLLER